MYFGVLALEKFTVTEMDFEGQSLLLQQIAHDQIKSNQIYLKHKV